MIRTINHSCKTSIYHLLSLTKKHILIIFWPDPYKIQTTSNFIALNHQNSSNHINFRNFLFQKRHQTKCPINFRPSSVYYSQKLTAKFGPFLFLFTSSHTQQTLHVNSSRWPFLFHYQNSRLFGFVFSCVLITLCAPCSAAFLFTPREPAHRVFDHLSFISFLQTACCRFRASCPESQLGVWFYDRRCPRSAPHHWPIFRRKLFDYGRFPPTFWWFH